MRKVKRVYSFEEIKDKIVSGVMKLSAPVIQTLTPKGSNVIISLLDKSTHTNDGITIANEVELEDPVENAFAKIIRESAQRTNSIAGDGTTTSILLAGTAVWEGIKLLDDGWKPMVLKKEMIKAGNVLLKHLESFRNRIVNDKILRFVAGVSCSNDEEITANVFDTVSFTGTEGFVLLDTNSKVDTEIRKEKGFTLDSGLFSPLLANAGGKAHYKNVKILVTDKRIYNADEVIKILTPLAENGIDEVVIVARDFIGQSPNVFITNHVKGKMKILLVKDASATDKNTDTLEDLSAYIGVPLVTEKAGKLTFDVTINDFGTAKDVISYRDKTIIACEPNMIADSKARTMRELMEESNDDDEKDKLKKRLARMTTGTARVLVGGRTTSEIRDKVFRYEDSINATRSAMREGYAVGGGVSLYNAYKIAEKELYESCHPDVVNLIRIICYAPMNQIATNCNLNIDEINANFEKGLGYNAITERYENLEKAGIIEPFLVTKLSFENAISVGGVILGSGYFIIEEEIPEFHPFNV